MLRRLVAHRPWPLVAVGLIACRQAPAHKPPPPASHAHDKPVSIHGELPVAPFVAEELLEASDARLVVYVGASWCEPCQRFHQALQSGALDDALRGVRFVEYDLDLARSALEADGYRSRLIPLFALPAPDGRATEHKQEGSIKGDGAVQNILPRLQQLLAAPPAR
jgi:thiol-disulfide isomerase/thioredoxin